MPSMSNLIASKHPPRLEKHKSTMIACSSNAHPEQIFGTPEADLEHPLGSIATCHASVCDDLVEKRTFS
jgi:hypothetical protein